MAKKKQDLTKRLLETEGIQIAPPISHLSILSNRDNIDFAIQHITQYRSRPVVSFDIIRSQGIQENNYRLVSRKRADVLKKADPRRFDYIALEKLISRKSEIEQGKYKIYNGTIVGITL